MKSSTKAILIVSILVIVTAAVILPLYFTGKLTSSKNSRHKSSSPKSKPLKAPSTSTSTSRPLTPQIPIIYGDSPNLPSSKPYVKNSTTKPCKQNFSGSTDCQNPGEFCCPKFGSAGLIVYDGFCSKKAIDQIGKPYCPSVCIGKYGNGEHGTCTEYES